MKSIRFMCILSVFIIVHNNVQAGLEGPMSTVIAPYPKTIYDKVVTLNNGESITKFDYSMDFTGAPHGTQLYVSPANLALIPAGASVVFTGNAVANSSGGYDAVVTAYNLITQQPYFTQSFPSIMQFSGVTPSTVTTNKVPSTATWKNTYVLYSLSNGATNQIRNIGSNRGFSFVRASRVAAPYPKTIYDKFVILNVGEAITKFDYSMDFVGARYATQLYVSQENLALIPIGAPVVFTGNAVANSSSGGYDAAVAAYNPITRQSYFIQNFPFIMQFHGIDPSTVTTNKVPSTATWNNTYVLYSLRNGVQNKVKNIGANRGFSFLGVK